MSDVDRVTAFGWNDPNVPGMTFPAMGVSDPAHIGRPCEIAATDAAPLRTGNVNDPARLTGRKGNYIKPTLFAGHPEAELVSIGRDTNPRDVLFAFPEQCRFQRGEIQLVETSAEIAIRCKIEFLAIFGPGEIRIVPDPVGETASEIGIATGDAFGFIDADGPDIASQPKGKGLSIGSRFGLENAGGELFSPASGLFFIAGDHNGDLFRFLLSASQDPNVGIVFEGNIARFGSDTGKTNGATRKGGQLLSVPIQVEEPQIGRAMRVINNPGNGVLERAGGWRRLAHRHREQMFVVGHEAGPEMLKVV